MPVSVTMNYTFPDAAARDAAIDDFCAATGWTSESGVIKGEWVRQQIIRYIKGTVRTQRERVATEALVVPPADIT